MPPPKGRRKFPDEAHEDLAVWVEETIAAQATTGSDVGDSLLLADTLFTLVDQATASIANLTARLAVLEAAATPAAPVTPPPPPPIA